MGGGGGGSQNSFSMSIPIINPLAQSLANMQLANVENIQPLYDQIILDALDPNVQYNPYPGSAIAGFNPLQQAAQGNVLNTAQFMDEALLPALTERMGFGLYGALDVDNNPYLAKAMEAAVNPMVDNFMRNTMPMIGSQAVNAGAFGGTRHAQVEANAANDFIRNVGDTTSTMASNAYNKGLDTFQQTLQFAPQYMQMLTRPAELLAAVGDEIQGYEQALLDEDVAKFNAMQNPNLAKTEQYLDVLTGMSNLTGGVSTINSLPHGSIGFGEQSTQSGSSFFGK